MFNTPIPGLDSAGFDQLSTSYDTEEQAGLSDIASRGLTTTGATPELYRGLQGEYSRGAANVVAQGAQTEDQQRLQILNSMLGLGSAGLNVSRANTGNLFENLGFGSDILEGLFGLPTSTNFLTGAPGGSGGLLSKGVGNFLSQLGI